MNLPQKLGNNSVVYCWEILITSLLKMLVEALAGLTIVGITLNPIQARVKGITRLLLQCSWLTKFSKDLLFIYLLLR